MDSTHDARDASQPGAELTPAELFRIAADRALDHEDAVDRAREITALLKAIDDRQKELTDTRRADVQEMRKTMTLAAVGTAISLSTGRVDQIAKGK
ncbi:hypothetical protein AB0K09_00550 [Streptomyces sp. NPDC049577]|uniref:hypothetical protein n=1 Tax=Streptomyces sp. NPDC049577 TaxID=3155153 RepID=UPI0034130F45